MHWTCQMVSKSSSHYERHDSNIVVAAHIPIVSAGSLAHDIFALVALPEFLLGVK